MEVNKMKIVLLSNYRSGSSAFCNVLSKMFKVPNFGELLCDRSQYDYKKINFDKYVIKIMPDHEFHPLFSELIKSSVVYGLYRRDAVQQITSYYISSQRNVWHNKNYTDTESYNIEYDVEKVKTLVNRVLTLRKDYEEKMKPLCIKEFVYEDIQPLLQVSDYKKYNKPSNYEELTETIKKLVNSNYEIIQ
jgi:hypothetical protein